MVFISSRWRPRRSLLFVPAANRRALEKSASLPCDGLIFDLEDSVAPGERDAARTNLAELRSDKYGGRERVVRLTGVGTETFEGDARAALACKPDAILLPKVESAGEIEEARARFGTGTSIWAMIETPLAILDIRAICFDGSRSGLEVLVVGPNDLSKTTGTPMLQGRAAFLPWLMSAIAGARAFDLGVLDGVYNDFRDKLGFLDECQQGAALGFDGKTLIHPSQIETANAEFGPQPEEVERARRIVEAFEHADNRDRGVIQIDGEMVERLHLDMARRLLDAVRRFDK